MPKPPRKKKPEAITVTREPDSEVKSSITMEPGATLTMPDGTERPILLTAEELAGGTFTLRPGLEVPILLNTDGRWSIIGWRIGDPEMGDVIIDPDGSGRMVGGKPIGYTALLMPLRSEFPARVLHESPITDAEWSAMVEAIRASEEDVIALPVPASCFDEFTLSSPDPAGEATTIHTLIEPRLRQCADALRVTACALGVGLTFYPRKASTHTLTIPKLDKGGMRKRRPDEATVTEVPAALMVRRMS